MAPEALFDRKYTVKSDVYVYSSDRALTRAVNFNNAMNDYQISITNITNQQVQNSCFSRGVILQLRLNMIFKNSREDGVLLRSSFTSSRSK